MVTGEQQFGKEEHRTRVGEALADYAFRPDGGHNNAILEQRRKDFHRESAFIRFRPYGSEGGLAGRNPLLASWM